MILRENRVTQEHFWGCARYPSCKKTLPETFAGKPMAQAQHEHEASGGDPMGPELPASRSPKKATLSFINSV